MVCTLPGSTTTRLEGEYLEVLVARMTNVLVCVDAYLVVGVGVSDSGINTHSPAILVVHCADLKALAIAADEARLLPAVPRGAFAHH